MFLTLLEPEPTSLHGCGDPLPWGMATPIFSDFNRALMTGFGDEE